MTEFNHIDYTIFSKAFNITASCLLMVSGFLCALFIFSVVIMIPVTLWITYDSKKEIK